MKEGDGAREFRELVEPLEVKGGADDLNEREEDTADPLPDRRPSFLP